MADLLAYDVLMLAEAELRVDWVSHYLFESSSWIIITGLAIVWTVMRVTGRRTGNARLRKASWVPIGLALVLFVMATLVTTPREKLSTALDDLLLSVEDQDFKTFRSVVSEDAVALFPPGRSAERYTREMVERRLKETKVRDLVLLADESAVMNDQDGVTVIRIRAQGDYDGIAGVQIYDWAIQWRYVDGRWQAEHFECLKIGFNPGSNN